MGVVQAGDCSLGTPPYFPHMGVQASRQMPGATALQRGSALVEGMEEGSGCCKTVFSAHADAALMA